MRNVGLYCLFFILAGGVYLTAAGGTGGAADLTLAPDQGIAGGAFMARGNVEPGARGVRFLWDDGRTARGLAEVAVDPSGWFFVQLSVPADTQPGLAHVFAIAMVGGDLEPARAPFRVLPTPPGGISGTVVLKGRLFETPVAGAEVRLVDARGTPVGTVFTDPEGAYVFPVVVPGSYHVAAIKDGNYFLDTDIVVPVGDIVGNKFVAVPEAEVTAPAIVTFVGGIAVPGPLLQSAYPVLITDQMSAKETGVIALLPAVPSSVGAVNLRFWADVQFPGAVETSQREVVFRVRAPNGALLWDAHKTSLQIVYVGEPALGFEAYTSTVIFFDMNASTFPPGDLTLSVMPYIDGVAGQGKEYIIRMVDLTGRWFKPWVAREPDPATGAPLRVIGSGGSLMYIMNGALPVSSLLPFDLPFTVPVFNKTFQNRISASVPAIQEVFVAAPGKGLRPGAVAPKLDVSTKLFSYEIFHGNYAYKTILKQDGSLSRYERAASKVAGPKTFLKVPLYKAGPGVGCWDPCPDFCCGDCPICAGWGVYIDFTLSGQVDLGSRIRSDLALEVDVVPSVSGTIGGHAEMALVVCSGEANISGTVTVGLPFHYQRDPEQAGFINKPCVKLSGSADGSIGCLGLGFGGGGTIGPYTIYGCSSSLAADARPAVAATTALDPWHVSPSPAVAADGAGNAMAVWVQDESRTADRVLPFLHYSRFIEGEWTAGERVTPLAAFLHEPQVGFIAGGRALAVWVQNRRGLDEIAAAGQAEASEQELFSATWEGAGWTDPVPMTDDLNPDGTPSLATDPQRAAAVVVWTRRVHEVADRPTPNDFAIFFSELGRAGWSRPAPIVIGASSIDYDPAVELDPEGDGHAVWLRDGDGDLTTFADRQIMVAEQEGGLWNMIEPIPGTLEGAFNPALALDPAGEPLVVFTVPPTFDGTLLSGVGNRSTLWFARRSGGSWTVGPIGENTYCESPRVEIDAWNHALVMFRRFSDDEIAHRDGDLGVAFADLGAREIAWSLDYLTGDGLTNWKTAFALDRETQQSFVVNVKQSALADAFAADDRAAGAQPGAATMRLHAAGIDGPGIAMMAIEGGADLAIESADIALSNGHPGVGESVVISAIVRNRGLGLIDAPFSVAFYDRPLDMRVLPFARIAVNDRLPVGGAATVAVRYVLPEGGLRPITLFADDAYSVPESDESNNAAVAMLGAVPAPSGVVGFADLDAGAVRLAWDPPLADGIARYEIRRSLTPGWGHELVGTTVAAAFDDVLVQEGASYSYIVQAWDEYGVGSEPSSEETVLFAAAPDEAPSLEIARSGSDVVLSWPSSAEGFVLQEALRADRPEWTDVGLPIEDDGATRSVRVRPAGPVRVYRLVQEGGF